MLTYCVRRRKSNFVNNDTHDLIDLTSIGTTGSNQQVKRKMVPPNVSNRINYSYEDQIDSDASIQLLGDSADYDAANTLNISRNEPEDPEDEFLDEIQMADRMGISPKGQGFTGFVEETYWPASGKVTSKKLI